MSEGSPSLVCLIVLDGWGVAPPGPGNAISLAETPNFNRLQREFPHTDLAASGEDVGLPSGQMGNSEVGHLNLGAGRIVYQDLTRINHAIQDGSFFQNHVLLDAIRNARKREGVLHLLGLLSDGGVHSDIEHVKALLKMASKEGLSEVVLHAFMDGRDTPPSSGIGYMEEIMAFMDQEGIGRVATVSGRYYAMDRDNRWDRVHRAYEAIVYGKGPTFDDPLDLLQQSYQAGITDEFVIPSVISASRTEINDLDSVIFFNFRPDRARELTSSLIFRDFDEFDRGPKPPYPYFVSMTEYDSDFTVPFAYPPEDLRNVLAQVLSQAGKKQLHIAETEKYAHVTFFFNGGVEAAYPGEDRVLIPSPTDVATYDEKPEMSARIVSDELLSRLESKGYDFVIVNLANCDMVGHTGNLEATIEAVEVVDECIGRITSEVASLGGVSIITADHGNAESMKTPEGEPETAHSSGSVPLIITMPARTIKGDSLADVAPTVLELLGVAVPAEMTGQCMICD